MESRDLTLRVAKLEGEVAALIFVLTTITTAIAEAAKNVKRSEKAS